MKIVDSRPAAIAKLEPEPGDVISVYWPGLKQQDYGILTKAFGKYVVFSLVDGRNWNTPRETIAGAIDVGHPVEIVIAELHLK